jgi:flagella basal body P-ring formation protein FlgA
MMMRRLVLLAAVMIAALPGDVFADTMLLPNATVTGDTIHIGDIFADAGSHAGDAIAPAPAPGTRVTFNAAWLGSIAREHHVVWQPSSDFDQSSVERATRTIAADTVAARILTDAAPTSASDDASVQLDNPGLRFIVPAEASDAMTLDGLTVDPRTGRFTVFVTAPADTPNAQRQRVTGRVVYQVTVPVPTRALAIGDVFGANDVNTIKLPRERVAADAVTDPQALIGKAARHGLRPGEIVHASDVEEPVVVHKGDMVSIELNTDTMQLTAQGKALDDGARGASIRIANTQSNRTIDALVIGPNRVTAGTAFATANVASR